MSLITLSKKARPAPPLSARGFTLAEVLVALALLAPLGAAAVAFPTAALEHARAARERALWVEHALVILDAIEHRALREPCLVTEQSLEFSDLRMTFEGSRLLASPIRQSRSTAIPHPLLRGLSTVSFSPDPPRVRLQSTRGDALERFISSNGARP